MQIAQGALTNSKRPQVFPENYPKKITYAKDCFLYDDKKNKYFDFICALGTCLLGYSNDDISRAIMQQLCKGNLFSLASDVEEKFCEAIAPLVPFADRIKVFKTGSESCTAACVIARAHENHRLLFQQGFNGWHPEFQSLTPPSCGVPEHLFIKKLDTYVTDQIVILEPVITKLDEERLTFLRGLKSERNFIIFDETITALRFPKHTFSNEYDITPDLIILGKALGNGFPISIVAGKKEIMDNNYFTSGTFCGDTLGMIAGMKVLELLKSKYNLTELYVQANNFCTSFNQLHPDLITIEGYGTRGVFKGNEEILALFFQEACKAGLLFGRSFFLNFSHLQYLDEILNICNAVLKVIKLGACKLEGRLPELPISAKARG